MRRRSQWDQHEEDGFFLRVIYGQEGSFKWKRDTIWFAFSNTLLATKGHGWGCEAWRTELSG